MNGPSLAQFLHRKPLRVHRSKYSNSGAIYIIETDVQYITAATSALQLEGFRVVSVYGTCIGQKGWFVFLLKKRKEKKVLSCLFCVKSIIIVHLPPHAHTYIKYIFKSKRDHVHQTLYYHML